MGTDLPEEAIRSLISTLSGVHVSRVRWEGEVERITMMMGGKAGDIVLNVTAMPEPNGLEPRRVYDPGTQKLTQQWGAVEEMTISVRADNFVGRGKAYNLLRKVRFALMQWGGTSQAALKAAGLAFIEAPSITRLDYSVDNREVSSASLDVRLAQMVTGEVEEIGWIEKVTRKSAPLTDEQVAALPVVDISFNRT